MKFSASLFCFFWKVSPFRMIFCSLRSLAYLLVADRCRMRRTPPPPPPKDVYKLLGVSGPTPKDVHTLLGVRGPTPKDVHRLLGA